MKADPPPESRPFRPTSLLIALVSFYCGLAARRLPWWMVAAPAAVAVGGICWYLVVRGVLALAVGERCPSCGRSTMERRAVVGFGDRFYACSSCGARRKRLAIGPWKDASGPEFDDRYAATPEEDPWSRPPHVDDGEAVVSKTHSLLVRSKRRRNPDAPNGPGLPS